jgi:uncharacterized protein
MKFGLNEEVIKKIQGVFWSFPEINQVILYGSRAKGNQRPGSDIDLVICNSTVDFPILLRISSALEDLHTPYTFDLSVFETIKNPELLEHIQRVGKTFYSKPTPSKPHV